MAAIEFFGDIAVSMKTGNQFERMGLGDTYGPDVNKASETPLLSTGEELWTVGVESLGDE